MDPEGAVPIKFALAQRASAHWSLRAQKDAEEQCACIERAVMFATNLYACANAKITETKAHLATRTLDDAMLIDARVSRGV